MVDLQVQSKKKTIDMENMTYTAAVARLEEIMSLVQSGQMDVDALAGTLKEATELLRFCNEKLHKVDEEVKTLLEGAASNTGE